MKFRTGYTLAVMAIVTLITVWPLSSASGLVAAAPTFTGDVPADFVGPDVIKIDDPSFGIGLPDVGVPIQFPADRISGWEMNAVYFEYDYASDTMYVGIDCFVICGDADGDGDPGTTGPILEGLLGRDQADFGGTESFALLIDTDNDCDTNADSAIDAVVGVPLGPNINALGAFTFVGSPTSPSTSFGDPLDNPVTLFANPSADSPDLEFSIGNFSTLPGFDLTPGSELSFQVNAFMGSLEDDGIGEDFLTGATECIPVVPPPPTPTPPPPTETPVVPTPTPTMPPPTELPPTGPNAQDSTRSGSLTRGSLSPWGMAPDSTAGLDSAVTSEKVVVPYHGPAPQRIEIDAIDLDSNISPMSWYYITDQEGNQVPQWKVTDYAVGWHINSTRVGEPGNVVMSGHNTIGGSVFQDLSLLKSGDTISVWGEDQTEYSYRVNQIRVVPEKDVDLVQQEANAKWLTNFGDERLTLISCWPDYSSAYRIIVVAHRELE